MQAYHSANIFLAQPSGDPQKVKETFLPFWATSAGVRSVLKAAQIGVDNWVSVYNPATRRMEPQLRTTWRWVRVGSAWQRFYGAGDAGMQVYASYKYPRPEINRLRPGVAIAAAIGLDPGLLASPSGGTRRVGPFNMKPHTALSFARAFMAEQERGAAAGYVRDSFRCDRVGELDLDIEVTALRAAPVYVPAYVFRRVSFGVKMRTFVSGVDASRVAGKRAYDEGRIALAAGAAAGLGLIITGAAAWFSSAAALFTWGIALPATAAGLAARYLPRLRLQWEAFRQQREQQGQAADNAAGAWDAEWVAAFSAAEEAARQRAQRSEEARFARSAWGTATHSPDPRGYYTALGVEPGASQDEVQAAFRGQAMRTHPDRFPVAADKKAAEARFQRLNEAYSVLRDPARRRQYDAGG